jgi:hypothetical protein
MVKQYRQIDSGEGFYEFNMGVASMQRIDGLIRQITEYKSMVYVNGNPTHSIVLRLLKELYKELYPYLDDKEHSAANVSFLQIFKDNPIINTGNGLLIPKITEDKMEEFELWVMKTMMDKGILTKIGESPYDLEL